MKEASRQDQVLAALSKSQVFRDYREAFMKATGLPLELHGLGNQIVLRPANAKSAPLCALMARTKHACAPCYALKKQLREKAQTVPRTLKCFAGLSETVVPVRVGGNLIGFLRTGQVLVDHPGRKLFNRVAKELMCSGTHVDLKQVEEHYLATRVLSKDQYKSLIRLLSVFAQHLATCVDELALQRRESEPPAVRRAREIIELSHQEKLSLGKIAGLVNVSATYFSELFKRATGMTFVEYVARVRVEKARNMLQNPDARISEVAFEVGFQSLSQFNRTFKRIAGQSPSNYRRAIAVGANG